MSIGNINNYFDGAAPTCPKCKKTTLLQAGRDSFTKQNVYHYICPTCRIFPPYEISRARAVRRFAIYTQQYKPQEAKNMLELYNDGKGGGIATGKLTQPLEAGTDLNQISAAGVYGVDTSSEHDITAILFKETETEALTKAIEYMRAQGYIVEATKTGFFIKGKAAGGVTNDL